MDNKVQSTDKFRLLEAFLILGHFSYMATAYSSKSFWYSNWNRFDILLLIIVNLDILVELMEALEAYTQPLIYIYVLAFIRLFRLIHCIRLIRYFAPMLMNYVTRGINSHLYENYQFGMGFVLGEQEVRRTIGRRENAKIGDENLKIAIDNNLKKVLKELANLYDMHPTVVTSVKTNLAIIKIFNDVRPQLDELKCVFMNDLEFEVVLKVFNKMIISLNKIPKSIPITANRYNIVQTTQWMTKPIYAVLEQGIRFDTYAAGTILSKCGRKTEGVFIIISGLAKITGIPDQKEHKILPNSDSIYYFTENSKFHHLMGVRDSFGLLGVLNKGECVTEARCETNVEVGFIPIKNMWDAVERIHTQPSLQYNLWRLIAVRLGHVILHRLSHFLRYSKGKIQDKLANALLPNFVNCKEFWKTDEIHDIILIQGCIKSKQTDEIFYGPIYIPRHVVHLQFMADNQTPGSIILLLLADDDYILPRELEWDGQVAKHQKNRIESEVNKGWNYNDGRTWL